MKHVNDIDPCPILINGFRRSGTTALFRAIGNNNYALTYEWKLLCFNELNSESDLSNVTSYLNKIVNSYRSNSNTVYRDTCANLTVNQLLSNISSDNVSDILDIIEKIYSNIVTLTSSAVWGDKVVELSINSADLIISRWPGTKIIYIYRDGRDVAASCVFRKFYSSFDRALSKWSEYVTEWHTWCSQNKNNVLCIKQEELLVNTNEVGEKVEDFIHSHIDYDELKTVLFFTSSGRNGYSKDGKSVVAVATDRLAHCNRWEKEYPNAQITDSDRKALQLLGYR